MNKLTCVLALLPVCTLAAGGSVKLKDGSLCVDSAGADDQAPVKAAACSGAASQLFLYDSNTRFVELSTDANTCWEDWWGQITGNAQITLFAKGSGFDPSDKHFHWNSASGAVTREGSPNCMTSAGAGKPLQMQTCTGAANQQWVADWSPAPSPSPSPPGPSPSPSPSTCAKLGCIAYKHGLPCQCNTDCHQYQNCCSDFDTVCKKATVEESRLDPASCTGTRDWQPIFSPKCYAGQLLSPVGGPEKVLVEVKSYESGKGHMDVYWHRDLHGTVCQYKSFTMTRQDIAIDFSDCLPHDENWKDVKEVTMKYCSDSDTVLVTAVGDGAHRGHFSYANMNQIMCPDGAEFIV